MSTSAWRWPIIFLVAAVLGLAGAFPAAVTRLVLYETFADPLTLFVLGILTGLVAFWGNTLLPGGRRGGGLMPTVGATVALALLLAAIHLALLSTRGGQEFLSIFSPPGALLITWAALLAAAAALFTTWLPPPPRRWGRDIVISLGLLATVVAAIAVTVAIAAALGLAGA